MNFGTIFVFAAAVILAAAVFYGIKRGRIK
jgi:hypothetical protein